MSLECQWKVLNQIVIAAEAVYPNVFLGSKPNVTVDTSHYLSHYLIVDVTAE